MSESESMKEQATGIMDEIEHQIVPAHQAALAEAEPAADQEDKMPDWADQLLRLFTDAISKADVQAAEQRVTELRAKYPDASVEELVERLIKRKSQQTATVGATTSAASLLPVLGTFASLTLGVAADIGATFKLQAELVLEIAAAHGYELSDVEKQRVVMLVTGISTAGNQLLTRTGREVSVKLTERYAQKWVTRALPVIGVVASAGTNVLSTYVIGQRADAYFSRGPEAVGDWDDSLRAIVGVDERKIGRWLAENTSDALDAVRSGVREATDTLSDPTSSVTDRLGRVGRNVVKGVATAGRTAAQLGRETGEVLVEKAGDVADAAGDRAGRLLGREPDPAALPEPDDPADETTV